MHSSEVSLSSYNVIVPKPEDYCLRHTHHGSMKVGRAETECDGTRKRVGGEVKGKKANGGGSQQSCTVSDTVYPALLPLMRTPRLPAAD